MPLGGALRTPEGAAGEAAGAGQAGSPEPLENLHLLRLGVNQKPLEG